MRMYQLSSFAKYRIRRVNLAILVLATLLLVLVVGIMNWSMVSRQFQSWHVLPRPVSATNLYFETTPQLPTTYRTKMQQVFGFGAHNLENRTVTYTFQVIQTSEDRSRSELLTSGTFSLPQDGVHTETVPILPLDLGELSRITTVLTIPGTNPTAKPVTKSIEYMVRHQGS